MIFVTHNGVQNVPGTSDPLLAYYRARTIRYFSSGPASTCMRFTEDGGNGGRVPSFAHSKRFRAFK